MYIDHRTEILKDDVLSVSPSSALAIRSDEGLTLETSAFRISVRWSISGQCGPVVRALALRSGYPGFKTRSDLSLNLFLVVPG